MTDNQPTLQKTTVTSGFVQFTAQMTILKFAGQMQKLRPRPSVRSTEYLACTGTTSVASR